MMHLFPWLTLVGSMDKSRVATEVIGVDYLEREVEKINADGRYTILCADVTKESLDDIFDVVVAGI